MATFPNEDFSLVLYLLYIFRLSIDINVFSEVSIEITMLVREHFCPGKHSLRGSSEIKKKLSLFRDKILPNKVCSKVLKTK